MDQREMFEGLAHLVALEGADKVPFRVRRQGGNLFQGFLNPVFSEDALSRIVAGQDVAGRKRFADGYQAGDLSGVRRVLPAARMREIMCSRFCWMLMTGDISSRKAVRARGS